MSNSFLVSKNLVVTFVETGNKLLLRVSGSILILINWEMVEQVKVNGILNIRRHMLLPGFNMDSFPFILSQYQNTYDIINIKNGCRSTLILGSAKSVGFLASFFVEEANGLTELHVCTTRRNTENTKWK